MKEKLILGISGSPRKDANSDFLLKTALAAAERDGGIRTELIFLRDFEIHYCNGCLGCCSSLAASKDLPCVSFRDDMDLLYPRLRDCDGLILASPVYLGAVTAQMKTFMDRTMGLLRYGMSSYRDALRNKVGAGIVMGSNRNGGQELTLQGIHYYFIAHDMVVAGSGPDVTPGCYLGGAGMNYPQRGVSRNSAEKDELGIKSSEIAGRRIAELVKSLHI